MYAAVAMRPSPPLAVALPARCGGCKTCLSCRRRARASAITYAAHFDPGVALVQLGRDLAALSLAFCGRVAYRSSSGHRADFALDKATRTALLEAATDEVLDRSVVALGPWR